MAKDVNIHVKATGTGQTKQKLESVGRSAKQVGSDVKSGGNRGAKAMDKMSGSAEKARGRFARLGASVVAWGASLVGVTMIVHAVTSAIKAQMQAMEEHAAIAAKQQKSLLSLQYLGEFFRERPELRKEVAAYAEYGRRPYEEVAVAWYNLRSKAARLTPEQRKQILIESLELGRTQPEAQLDTIVDMFSLYVKSTGEVDINKVQNILQQTITEAGGGGADVAKYLPQFLPVGMAGGLSGPEAAGLWAHITTLMAEPAIATTGLKAVFMALQGKGTTESKKMLSELGIEPDMDFFQKLSALSAAQQRGKFGLSEAELLFQREGATAGLLMLKDMPAMFETISKVTGAARGDIDITGDMIEDLMGEDEIAFLEEDIRRLGVQKENIKGRNVFALRWMRYNLIYENRLRAAGADEAYIKRALGWTKFLGAVGVKPEDTRWWTGEPIEFSRDKLPVMRLDLLPPKIDEQGRIEPPTGTRSANRGFGGTGSTGTWEGPEPQHITNVYHNIDNSTNYYPRFGEDDRGPRF